MSISSTHRMLQSFEEVAFDPSKLMPSTADDKLIEKNFTILISRVLKNNFPFFEKFATGVPKHIKHKFYEELSEIVSKMHDHS